MFKNTQEIHVNQQYILKQSLKPHPGKFFLSDFIRDLMLPRLKGFRVTRVPAKKGFNPP